MENHGSYDKDSLFILTAADRRPNTGVPWRAGLRSSQLFWLLLRRGVAAKGDFLFFLTKEPQRISFPFFFLYNSALDQSHKIGTKSHNQGTKTPGSATTKGQRPQKRDPGVL